MASQASPAPSEMELVGQIVSVLCDENPAFTPIMELLAKYYGADHYLLVEYPDWVTYHFILCADILGLHLDGPGLKTSTGGREIVQCEDGKFAGLEGVKNVLIVPVTEKLFVALTNPQKQDLIGCVIEAAVHAIQSLASRVEIDYPYSLKFIENISDEKMEELARRSFTVISYHPSELFLFVIAMFIRSGISVKIGIDSLELLKFVVTLRRHYNPVPYHNWSHALDVTQFVYSVITRGKVGRYLDDLEVFGLMFSAICHDTDHNGMNNAFHRKAGTVLAHLAHGTLPPLEHHHSCITQDLARKLLKGIPEPSRMRLSKFVIDCIMATDMEQHKAFLSSFGQIEGGFNQKRPEHRQLLAQIILKAADLSNTVRDFEEARRMSAELTRECHRQGDKEVELGLPISPMCDRNDKTPMCVGQVGFYQFVAQPLMHELHEFFPELHENEEQFQANLGRWKKMKAEWEAQKDLSEHV